MIWLAFLVGAVVGAMAMVLASNAVIAGMDLIDKLKDNYFEEEQEDWNA